MTSISNRDDLINYLLRRQFGTLAPPPTPTIKGDAALVEARRQRALRIAGLEDQRPAMERQRAAYESLGRDELQRLIDEAHAEDAKKTEALVAHARSRREAMWPHWAKKDLWSEAELAALCCGLIPDERGMPSDPGKNELHAVAINRAGDDIRRGTLSGTLQFVSRNDADTADRMYGTARHFEPAKAVDWAAARFDTFPQGLLDAVRQRGGVPPSSVDTSVEAPNPDKPLDERERTTLLCIIGALARQLDLDLAQPMKAGQTVVAMAPELTLSARTIGEKLKLVHGAMESRSS